MSAITTANVTTIDSWERGTKSGQRVDLAQRVSIALTAQGGTTGDIPASALGLAEIYEVSPATLIAGGNPTAVHVGIAANGLSLFPAAFADGTPANQTGVLNLTVYGRSL